MLKESVPSIKKVQYKNYDTKGGIRKENIDCIVHKAGMIEFETRDIGGGRAV